MPTQEDSPPQRNILPLAPLEYLQTHRRGSITDPSLHAAKQSQNFRIPADLSSSSSTSKDPRDEPRPSSAYVFGDATPHVGATESPGLRKILRSPSSEHDGSRPNTSNSEKASKGGWYIFALYMLVDAEGVQMDGVNRRVKTRLLE